MKSAARNHGISNLVDEKHLLLASLIIKVIRVKLCSIIIIYRQCIGVVGYQCIIIVNQITQTHNCFGNSMYRSM